MAMFTKFNTFIEKLAEKTHNLGSDQLVVALTNVAPTAATDDQLADITQVDYTYCSSRNITTSASAQTLGTYKLTLTDLVLTASGGTVGPFRYLVVYNDTAAGDELVAYFDYGSSITLADAETLTIDFDGTDGFLQIAPV
jgi:hypothetical protein